MNKLLLSATGAVFIPLLCACTGSKQDISSPSGNIEVSFDLTETGQPRYSVVFDGEEIIKPSTLGFELLDGGKIAAY